MSTPPLESSSHFSTSSSSPLSTSTAPSSDMPEQLKEVTEEKLEVEVVDKSIQPKLNGNENENIKENNNKMLIDEDSSDVEIIESNGDSDDVKIVDTKGKKRKTGDQNGSTETKKAKVVTLKEPKAAVAKPVKSESKKVQAAKAKEIAEAVLVELKNGKFNLKQKVLNTDALTSTMKCRIAFTDYFATLLKDADAKITDWPVEHHQVVSRLIHESDKTLPLLVKHVQKQLVESVEGSLAALEDSQDSQEKDATSVGDRIPVAELKTLIESLATRTNYGLDISDLPNGLPEGVTEIPAGLQIWRWEIHDSDLLPAELESKLEKRKTERTEAKSEALKLFLALTTEEQSDLLNKSIKKGTKVVNATASTSKDTSSAGSAVASTSASASGPSSTPSTSTPKPKVAKVKKAPVEKVIPVETEEEKLAKEAKEAELQARKLAREAAQAERAAKQAEKKEKEDAKKAKELAIHNQASKQKKIMSSFFTKKSQSPAPSSNRGSSVPVASSSFEKTFLPFALKSIADLAPINRFKKYQSGKITEIKINSLESLTLADSLKSFLSDVPASRIIPYKRARQPQVSVRELVRSINDANLTTENTAQFYDLLNDRSKIKVKMLKFKEDVRPGYLGTWTKTSRVVTPRTPFGLDTHLLRYDYDSEDEWEEEADDLNAEELGSGGELSADEGGESEGLSDDWMCEDDEVEFEAGHSGSDEMIMAIDGDDDVLIHSEAKQRILDREAKAKAAKEGARKKKMMGPMLPTAIGPIWEEEIGQIVLPTFTSMRVQFLNDNRNGIYLGYNPETHISTDITIKVVAIPNSNSTPSSSKISNSIPGIASTSSSTPQIIPTTTGGASTSTAVATPRVRAAPRPLPPHLNSKLIEIIHDSEKTKPILIDLLVEEFKADKIAKNTIDAAMREVSKRVGKKILVNPEILEQYSSAIIVD